MLITLLKNWVGASWNLKSGNSPHTQLIMLSLVPIINNGIRIYLKQILGDLEVIILIFIVFSENTYNYSNTFLHH
jgi:hypothetical protein